MDSGILSKLSANGPIIVNSHRCQNTETGLQKLTSPRNNRLLFNSGDAAEPSRSQFHLIYLGLLSVLFCPTIYESLNSFELIIGIA